MVKKILTLEGVRELNQKEQKAIVGAALRRCCEYEFINGKRICTIWVSAGQYCP
jgi:hypothetical protein